MDARVFMEYYTAIDVNDLLLKAATIDDDVGTTLRLHLISERLIESWICACCNNAGLFGQDKNRVLVECSAKIEMAINLGLPEHLGKAFKVLNSLRNDIAHNPIKNSIPDSRIQSFAEKTDNHIRLSSDVTLSKRYVTVNSPDGNEVATVTMASDSSQNRLKLCLIFSVLMQEMMKFVASKHDKQWDNDFSQHQYSFTTNTTDSTKPT
ncbi:MULTISPECIES: hypothetical protein [Pantoea]|uniref:DUF4145 domain-containing protein n=1 Tax=Candidatus Pantoea gossypiicola TaxID=2608008 RepID=A0AB34CUU8_9GAMM|nr:MULTISPECIES: hypothetical protein [Pantoea]KAA5961010.1 hypothetical protein F3I55_00890 [Pantoea sp. VH_24]KAA5964451.1 hypothetical protein F3I53_01145 [Pantoea sp. VH_16]KAA5968612.1 hypothetical protein F3I54_01370 [Pantoea sp. VH_18]KAA6004320.1 hypothetical protein F3I46_00455 [Pantoea sp. M_1]KAA6006806.1 hypothetical protein F3I45_01120 [Pantoea sp. F_7]